MTVAAITSKVSAAGFRAGNLHHFWDTEFVNQLETNPQSIASDLIGHISRTQEKEWQAGKPSDWAKESFQVAKDDTYGQLPEPSKRGTYRLSEEYITTATDDVARQLSKAGVRLAFVLNHAGCPIVARRALPDFLLQKIGPLSLISLPAT